MVLERAERGSTRVKKSHAVLGDLGVGFNDRFLTHPTGDLKQKVYGSRVMGYVHRIVNGVEEVRVVFTGVALSAYLACEVDDNAQLLRQQVFHADWFTPVEVIEDSLIG